MYENIISLRPYFFSLREIGNNVSLDIKIPIDWKYEHIIVQYETLTYKVQDKNERNGLLSLISTDDRDGYETVFKCAKELINRNKEEEEKMKLFKEKIEELQQLFINSSLDTLKDLKFNNNDGENSKGTGVAGETTVKRSGRGGKSQTKDDQ